MGSGSASSITIGKLVEMFSCLKRASDEIAFAINHSLPSKAAPIQLAIAMLRFSEVPIRAAVVFALNDERGAQQLAAALELINLAVHKLHHNLAGTAADESRFGNAGAVLAGDYLCTGAFRLLVQCGSMQVMGVISSAVQRACEAELRWMGSASASTEFASEISLTMLRVGPLAEAAGIAAATLAGHEEEAIFVAGRFGRNIVSAYALSQRALNVDGGSKIDLAERAIAMLNFAHSDAEVLLRITGNKRPLELYSTVLEVITIACKRQAEASTLDEVPLST